MPQLPVCSALLKVAQTYTTSQWNDTKTKSCCHKFNTFHLEQKTHTYGVMVSDLTLKDVGKSCTIMTPPSFPVISLPSRYFKQEQRQEDRAAAVVENQNTSSSGSVFKSSNPELSHKHIHTMHQHTHAQSRSTLSAYCSKPLCCQCFGFL